MAGWILINDVSVREFYEPVYENLYKTLVYSLLFIILGAGFAVVADEVRKLAESTQKSLAQIEVSANSLAQSIVEMGEVVQSQTSAITHISEVGANMAQSAQANLVIIEQTQATSGEIDEIAKNIKDTIEKKKF